MKNKNFLIGLGLGVLIGAGIMFGVSKWEHMKEKRQMSFDSINEIMSDKEFIDQEQDRIIEEMKQHQEKMKKMMKDHMDSNNDDDDYFKKQEEIFKKLKKANKNALHLGFPVNKMVKHSEDKDYYYIEVQIGDKMNNTKLSIDENVVSITGESETINKELDANGKVISEEKTTENFQEDFGLPQDADGKTAVIEQKKGKVVIKIMKKVN